jgi:hypothetical protein
MKRLILGCACVLFACLPLEAQRRETPLGPVTVFGSQPGIDEGTRARGSAAPVALAQVEISVARERRGRRRNALTGGLIGAAVGGLYGAYTMGRTEDYLGPPAYFYTVPGGALLGALVGAMIP